MSKIWEIDFTSFSGVSNVLYDQVGTQHLTTYSGTINKQEPVIGFSNRKGVLFSNNGSAQLYTLYGPGGVPDISNGRFTASYSYRSFVLWIYTYQMGSGTYWDGASNEPCIWGSTAAAAQIDYGIGASQYGNSIGVISSSNILISTGAPLLDGWHSVIVTMDRVTPLTKLYVDKIPVASSVTVIGSGTPAWGEVIGDTGTTNEGTFYLGLAATYDHILNQSEINTIHDTFLIDSQVGTSYYQVFSGYVYKDDLAVSGAIIKTYSVDIGQIVHSTSTNVSGYYETLLPYSGTYVVFAGDLPYGGVQAISVIATSGQVYFP